MQCKPNFLYNFLILITQASILVQLVSGACERHAGLMVSTFDSRLKGLGSSPGRLIVLCSWARHFTLTVPFSTQKYKWLPITVRVNK